MPKQTISQQLSAGLLAIGWIELSPTTRYRRFSRPGSKTHAFVGAAGALRLSTTGRVSDTISVSSQLRQEVISAADRARAEALASLL